MTLTLTKKERRWGWFFLAAQLLVIPFAVTLVCALMGVTSEATINLICFYINAVLALVIFRPLLEQSFRNSRGKWRETFRTVLRGFGMYWVVNLAMTMVILKIDPDFANVNDQNIGSMLADTPLLMSLAIIVAAPLAEECLFRGWLFTGLARKHTILAYLVTIGVFSGVHVLGYIGMYPAKTLFMCFLQYLGPSYVLCRTCEKNDSLCAPLLLHMIINTIACIFMG